MQLRVVVERTAHVIAQFVFNRPANHVAHGVKIKMKIERDIVIESDAFVVNCVATNQSKTERDDLPFDSPDKKARAFRHLSGDADKKLPAQIFKLHRRPLVNLEIKRKNRVDVWCYVVDHFHVDFRVAFGLPELSPQTLAADIAKRSQVFVEIL